MEARERLGERKYTRKVQGHIHQQEHEADDDKPENAPPFPRADFPLAHVQQQKAERERGKVEAQVFQYRIERQVD